MPPTRIVFLDMPGLPLTGGVYLVWPLTMRQMRAALQAADRIAVSHVTNINVLSHLQNMMPGLAAGTRERYQPADGDLGIVCYREDDKYQYRMFVYRVLRGREAPVDTRRADPVDVLLREVGGVDEKE